MKLAITLLCAYLFIGCASVKPKVMRQCDPVANRDLIFVCNEIDN